MPLSPPVWPSARLWPSSLLTPVYPTTTRGAADILYGTRTTAWRWEVLAHSNGTDHLIGYLDGVKVGSATLEWTLNIAVKGSADLKVDDLTADQVTPGLLRIADVNLAAHRLRPVQIIDGLPEIPWGVYIIDETPEQYDATSHTYTLHLLDRTAVLDQDQFEDTYSVDTTTPILQAVGDVIASAGEAFTWDPTDTRTLKSPITWSSGDSDTPTKLKIVNDLLAALDYNSLRVAGNGEFRATPYVLPASRPTPTFEGIPLVLVDGPTSIYSPAFTRDRDMRIPNKVIASSASTGDTPALTGVWTNTDPDSPFSYAARGGRWIVSRLTGVQVPDGTDADIVAFLEGKAQQSLIAQTAVQYGEELEHLSLPITVGDVVPLRIGRANVDGLRVVTSIRLGAYALGRMKTELQEVISL